MLLNRVKIDVKVQGFLCWRDKKVSKFTLQIFDIQHAYFYGRPM